MKAREAEIEIQRWWRRPGTRRAVAWGLSGFALGAIFVLVMLLLFGPQPEPVQSQSPPGSSAISVTINDTFLTQAVAEGIKEAHLPIGLTNVHAHILPNDKITLSGNSVGLGGLLPNHLAATGQLYVAGGRLRVNITQASIGGIPLPGALTSALQNSINAQLVPQETSFFPTTTPYNVTGVSSRSGALTITFNPA